MPGASTSARLSDALASPVISFFSTLCRATASLPSASAPAATTLPSASICAAKAASGRFSGSSSRATGGVSSGVTTRSDPWKVTVKPMLFTSTRPSAVAAANALLCGGTAAAVRDVAGRFAVYTTLPSLSRSTRTTPRSSNVATCVR